MKASTMKTLRTLLNTLLLCSAVAVHAQPQGHAHHGTAAAPAATAAAPSTAEFEAGAVRMHSDMAIAYTGHADIDFARGMIPHHQGAIDMAQVQLRHGKDPAMRKLASDIIKAQEKEIAFLRQWLDKHDKAQLPKK
jgi:uncharacterized protein (DUF305 family)